MLQAISTCKICRGCALQLGGSGAKSGRQGKWFLHQDIASSHRSPVVSSLSHRNLRISLRVAFGCSFLWKWALRGHISQQRRHEMGCYRRTLEVSKRSQLLGNRSSTIPPSRKQERFHGDEATTYYLISSTVTGRRSAGVGEPVGKVACPSVGPMVNQSQNNLNLNLNLSFLLHLSMPLLSHKVQVQFEIRCDASLLARSSLRMRDVELRSWPRPEQSSHPAETSGRGPRKQGAWPRFRVVKDDRGS
jgi:hypothetical protein